jgi:hypothetical protein
MDPPTNTQEKPVEAKSPKSESAVDTSKKASNAPAENPPENNDAPPVTVPDPPIPPKQDILPVSNLPPGADLLHNVGTGWSAMARIVREVDEQKVKDYKEDIDTILVFVRCPHVLLAAMLM